MLYSTIMITLILILSTSVISTDSHCTHCCTTSCAGSSHVLGIISRSVIVTVCCPLHLGCCVFSSAISGVCCCGCCGDFATPPQIWYNFAQSYYQFLMVKIKTQGKYIDEKLRTTDAFEYQKMQQFDKAQKQRH